MTAVAEPRMLRSVSIHFMWDQLPMPERVRAAAAAGFDLVDLWDWRTVEIDEIARAAAEAGIGINGFFGNRAFSACDPAQRTAFINEVKESLACAVRVGARQLHLFSNAIRPGGIVVPSPNLPPAVLHAACVDAVSELAPLAAEAGVVLVLEHLNDVHLPGYLWTGAQSVIDVARDVDHPNVRVVFDAFHQQLGTGRLAEHLIAALPYLARVDVAGVPGRHEPGVGEIDFAYLRGVLDEHEWRGTLTFEVVPSDGNPDTAVRRIEEFFPAACCGQREQVEA
ncbi:TIM barrel protein [Pseudarthrobacter sp. P1]|uniref:TIM barrel protein n=1 Tax=Pseudarthrobacter sp. P1 TaxID=3418418 RepID=UPI003CF00734